MRYGEVEVKGKKFEVHVQEHYGDAVFQVIEENSEVVQAPSLAELKTKLATRVARKSAKVKIPFARYVFSAFNEDLPVGLHRGEVYGIHGSNSNILLRFEDVKGSKQERTNFGKDTDFIDPAVADELQRLGDAKFAADQAFLEFVEMHALDIRASLKAQLAKQIEADDIR